MVADITPTAVEKITAFLKTIDTYLDEHDALLGGNEIFQARVKGVGVIDRETAIAFGLTGAMDYPTIAARVAISSSAQKST